MENFEKIPPRRVPDRDSKYMGLAWFIASFSKDPYTQVGAVIVDQGNVPLGYGYNGLSRIVDDNEFSWERESPVDGVGRRELIIHAECNAIRHCRGVNLEDATLYVTALPCPPCMKEIALYDIRQVVYFDFQSDPKSSLRNSTWKNESFSVASKHKIELIEFSGNINWMSDWCQRLEELNLFS
jgi:dCMP deaminase